MKSLILFVVSLYVTSTFSSSDDANDVSNIKRDIDIVIPKVRPNSCRDVVSDKPRVVVILSSGIEVMCDTQTDGGGWTIFQRRNNGYLRFDRSWEEYKYGFRVIDLNEFYLGNEYIHRITAPARHELRIDFQTYWGNRSHSHKTYFVRFAFFSLRGEPEQYRLIIGGFSGNISDSLGLHNNKQFATYDRKRENKGGARCAKDLKGGWWFATNLCHSGKGTSNLNGLWDKDDQGYSLEWFNLTNRKNDFNRIFFTEMKFRERSRIHY